MDDYQGATLDDLFPTKGAISEGQQIGRGGAIEELVGRMLDGGDIIVLEGRREGKTSTISNGALRRIRDDHGGVVAEIDLRQSGVSEAIGLARHLRQSAIGSGAGSRVHQNMGLGQMAKLRRFLSGKRAAAAGQLLGGEEKGLQRAQQLLAVFAPDQEADLEKLLQALDADAEVNDRPVVVFIDEVQELASDRWRSDGRRVQEVLARAMGTSNRRVAYAFAGSDRHAISAIFTDGEPLYREGERYSLPPISREDWNAGLTERFAADGRELAEDAVSVVLDASGGHPLRTNQICRHLLRNARGLEANRIERAAVDEAIEQARAHPSWQDADRD